MIQIPIQIDLTQMIQIKLIPIRTVLDHLVCLFHWNACWTQTLKILVSTGRHFLPFLPFQLVSFLSHAFEYQSSVAREEERGFSIYTLLNAGASKICKKIWNPCSCVWLPDLARCVKVTIFDDCLPSLLLQPSRHQIAAAEQPTHSFCQRVLLIAPHFAAMDLCIIWSHKNPEIGIPFWTFPVDNCSVHCDTFSAKTLVPLGIWHLGFLGTLFLGLLIMFRFYSGNWVKQP